MKIASKILWRGGRGLKLALPAFCVLALTGAAGAESYVCKTPDGKSFAADSTNGLPANCGPVHMIADWTESHPASLKYEEIRTRMLQMTDAAFETLAGTYTGHSVSWEGWIKNVSRSGAQLLIDIDMDPPTEQWSVADVSTIAPNDERFVVALKETGTKVRVEGTILSIAKVLGSCRVKLKLEHLTVLNE